MMKTMLFSLVTIRVYVYTLFIPNRYVFLKFLKFTCITIGTFERASFTFWVAGWLASWLVDCLHVCNVLSI